MLYSNKNELSHVKQLKSEYKFTEALKLINILEDKKGLTVQDQFEIHLLKSTLLFEIGFMNKALNFAELACKESQQLKNKFQIIDALLTKITILNMSDKRNEALKIVNETEQLLKTIKPKSTIEFKEKKAYITLYKGGCYFNMGELNLSLKFAEEVLKIAKEINNKKLIMLATKLLNFNYYEKGDLDHFLEYHKRFLALAEELNDKQEIIAALNGLGMYFTEKGDYNQALNHLERSLLLCNEINSFKTVVILSSFLDVYLNTNSLEKAQQCLNRMKKLSDQVEFPGGIFYRLYNAMILKRKPQKTNHKKAKKILKLLIDEERPFSALYYAALIELCDLYLAELRETNDLKIINEVNPYINQLKDIAKNQQSFSLLVEVFSLQAKLKLITFEFKEPQILLNQALNTAEKHGLNRLAKRITNEQDELSNNFIKWEKMKASGTNISERMDLARIDEQVKNLLRKRMYLKIITDQA
ncbi:MAG: tetratricopeptide repeat protein [Candidatus Hodarchaeota archaeon]